MTWTSTIWGPAGDRRSINSNGYAREPVGPGLAHVVRRGDAMEHRYLSLALSMSLAAIGMGCMAGSPETTGDGDDQAIEEVAGEGADEAGDENVAQAEQALEAPCDPYASTTAFCNGVFN